MRISDWSSDVCSSDLCCATASASPRSRKSRPSRRRAEYYLEFRGSVYATSNFRLPPHQALRLRAGGPEGCQPRYPKRGDFRVAGPQRGGEDDAHQHRLRHRQAELGRGEGGWARHRARIQAGALEDRAGRSEEHTSELQSLMRISFAVFCVKKKNSV